MTALRAAGGAAFVIKPGMAMSGYSHKISLRCAGLRRASRKDNP
jgi:hypothetical protein